MKRLYILLFIVFFMMGINNPSYGQCSICTKTAQQLGERPAKGLNAGILYLVFAPLALVGFIGFKWWKKNKEAA